MKLSKKEWKTVTNLLFVLPITVILFLIKGTIGIVKWLINLIANAINATQKKAQQKSVSVSKEQIKAENELPFKDSKTVFTLIVVALLIILIIISAASHTDTDQEQNGNGDKTEINNSAKYDDLTNHSSVQFVINDDNSSYIMERKYDFPFPKRPPDIIVLPETFEGKPVTIWDGIFSEYNITEVVGSKNLEKICNDVFADKTDVSHMKLEKVIFPKDGNLKSVGRWAFFNNDKLHTVVVPQNFESFGVGAFYSCASLSSLVIYNETPPSGASSLFNDGYNEGFFAKPQLAFTVYVPDNAVETYKQSSWGQYNIRPISDFT